MGWVPVGRAPRHVAQGSNCNPAAFPFSVSWTGVAASVGREKAVEERQGLRGKPCATRAARACLELVDLCVLGAFVLGLADRKECSDMPLRRRAPETIVVPCLGGIGVYSRKRRWLA
jgi:hypothetical protein